MKKTINITLNGLVFNIEEDAYDRLNEYLEGLKSHFGTADYGKEVVADIESRISEQFGSKIKDRKKEVVTLAEVQDVIKNMGTLEDLTDSESQKSETKGTTTRRRLYRNPDDQIIAGVGSGIASYFNIDPIIPRILFVVFTLAGGSGVLLYILLWIIVPEAQTGSERLEMRGNAVTLANLEENRKKQEPKNFSLIKYFFQELFYLVGRFFRALGPIILTIVGLFVTVVTFIMLFMFTLIAIILVFNPHSAYIDPAVSQIFTGANYVMIILSAYAAMIIPILTALLIGISFVRRRNVFNSRIGLTFVVVWLSGALTFGFLAASAAPQIDAAIKSVEEQPVATKEFPATEFNIVEVDRGQKVKIVYGTQRKIVVSGPEEELERVKVDIQNKKLQFEVGDRDFRICLICINRPLSFEITTPDLTEVEGENASVIEISGFPAMDNLKINGSGAAYIKYDGDIEKMTVNLSNASRAELEGTAQDIDADISGASRLLAEDMITTNMIIDAENSSLAEINVTESLTAEASGASRILYKGDPKETQFKEANAARILDR